MHVYVAFLRLANEADQGEIPFRPSAAPVRASWGAGKRKTVFARVVQQDDEYGRMVEGSGQYSGRYPIWLGGGVLWTDPLEQPPTFECLTGRKSFS